jgi:hypothetical protein
MLLAFDISSTIDDTNSPTTSISSWCFSLLVVVDILSTVDDTNSPTTFISC